MSNRAMSAVFELGPAAELTAVQLLVLLALADNADEYGVCWPGLQLLERKTGRGRRTVTRTVDQLRERGLLTMELQPAGGGYTRTEYHLHVPGLRQRKDRDQASPGDRDQASPGDRDQASPPDRDQASPPDRDLASLPEAGRDVASLGMGDEDAGVGTSGPGVGTSGPAGRDVASGVWKNPVEPCTATGTTTRAREAEADSFDPSAFASSNPEESAEEGAASSSDLGEALRDRGVYSGAVARIITSVAAEAVRAGIERFDRARGAARRARERLPNGGLLADHLLNGTPIDVAPAAAEDPQSPRTHYWLARCGVCGLQRVLVHVGLRDPLAASPTCTACDRSSETVLRLVRELDEAEVRERAEREAWGAEARADPPPADLSSLPTEIRERLERMRARVESSKRAGDGKEESNEG